MCTSLDRAAGWADSTIDSMDRWDLAQAIQRYGRSHGVDSPSFNTLKATPHEVKQMRELVFQIRNRARGD